MVRHPVLGALAQMMWSFNSLSALYVTPFPQLQVLRTGACAASMSRHAACRPCCKRHRPMRQV